MFSTPPNHKTHNVHPGACMQDQGLFTAHKWSCHPISTSGCILTSSYVFAFASSEATLVLHCSAQAQLLLLFDLADILWLPGTFSWDLLLTYHLQLCWCLSFTPDWYRAVLSLWWLDFTGEQGFLQANNFRPLLVHDHPVWHNVPCHWDLWGVPHHIDFQLSKWELRQRLPPRKCHSPCVWSGMQAYAK